MDVFVLGFSLKEIEADLIIAVTAVKGNLVSFCSDVIDANSNWLNSLSP
jgi:hypothetical protein